MRLFAAVDLSDEARTAAAAAQDRIARELQHSQGALRLVRSEQLHVTLVFLGEVAEPQVPPIVAVMSTPVELPPYDLAIGTAGVFPSRGAPRVLWLGLTAGADQSAALQRLIADRLRAIGAPFEDRPFKPHLTIGRWRVDTGRRPRLPACPPAIATVRVSRVTLYQSRLSSSGSAYTALAHANLTCPSPPSPPSSART